MIEFKSRVVLRNDSTQNWKTNSSTVLLKGEAGLEYFEDGSVGIKFGDGVKTWAELDYYSTDSNGGSSKYYLATPEEGEDDLAALTRVVGDTPLKEGDFGVVKKLIHGDKYEYTAYIYQESQWKALDGNYNAENVFFSADLLTTSAIGNIALENGQATIPAAGKNLKQVFDTIFVKEQNPKITQPSVSISVPEAKGYEVGSKVTPTFNVTLNPGNYQFGPATNVTAQTWSIKDTLSNSAESNSGSFPEITVEDSTNYKITATATYNDGAIPVTNVGNEYADGQIKAGSKVASSNAITGYRNSFYGYLTVKEELNSAAIRGLSNKSNKALSNGAKFEVNVPVGAQRVVIAYPSTLREVTSITDRNGLNAEIKTSFTMSTIQVEGANEASAIDYRVYYIDFASPNDTNNYYDVTI